MAQEWAKAFYTGKRWAQCRDGYIKSVDGLCEECAKRGKVVPGYIVHHKTKLTRENINDPDIALNWDNLMYVCKDCHDNLHADRPIEYRYRVGVDGKLLPPIE